MDDHPSTYESVPRRSITQWLESEPLYDWLLAAYQNSRWSARQIEPFIRKHRIAEARYFGWETVRTDQQFPIKGQSLRVEHILGNAQRAWPFINGPVLLARLSPMDYHHVHYPDDGVTSGDFRLGRKLWTVNWHALQNQPGILFRNERQIQIHAVKAAGVPWFIYQRFMKNMKNELNMRN